MKQIYTLVGMKFRDSEQIVANMRRGTALTLRRAPDNPHDPYAVEVWHDGQHIAFIRATEARELAAMMDDGGHRLINGIFATDGDHWPHIEIDSR